MFREFELPFVPFVFAVFLGLVLVFVMIDLASEDHPQTGNRLDPQSAGAPQFEASEWHPEARGFRSPTVVR